LINNSLKIKGDNSLKKQEAKTRGKPEDKGGRKRTSRN
jgi:hypothetical protein